MTARLDGLKGFYRGFGITIAREVRRLAKIRAHAVTIHFDSIPTV
jgi:hypothetical protein